MQQHPFAELTNRTPSPAQKEDSSGFAARKHSPWTAARQKKKTRAVDQQQLPQQQQPLDGQATAPPPAHQQASAIPEGFASPAAHTKSVGGSAEYSFADRLSPGSQASPHSSPQVSKGSAQDADVHPSKAYLSSSPQCMDLGSAGGVDLAAAGAAGASTRSPVWFCSINGDAEGGAHADAGNPSSSGSRAPASGNLFERFDQVAQQRHQQHQQHCEPLLQQCSSQPQQQQQPAHAGQQAVVRGRRLTARRGAGGGCEQLHRALAASTLGDGSGTSSSSSCLGWRPQQQPQGSSLQHHAVTGGSSHSAAAGSVAQDSDTDFQLHSRLHIDDTVVERRRSFGGGFLQQRQQHWGDDDEARTGLGRGNEGGSEGGWGQLLRPPAATWRAAAAGFDDAEAGGCDDAIGTVEWFEAEMQEAADAGDMAAARHLWASLQAVGLGPTRRFLNCFLICCHYGGVDPLEAQEAVRDMCEAGGAEPDGLTTQLLSAIDISWQQLQCGR